MRLVNSAAVQKEAVVAAFRRGLLLSQHHQQARAAPSADWEDLMALRRPGPWPEAHELTTDFVRETPGNSRKSPGLCLLNVVKVKQLEQHRSYMQQHF